MVDKLIRWIRRILMRHGYRVLKEDVYYKLIAEPDNRKYQIDELIKRYSFTCKEVNAVKVDADNLFDCLNKLDTRISDLEKWREEQPEHIKQASEYTLKELIGEWVNGEGANNVAE